MMPEAAGVFGAGSTAEQLFVWQVAAEVISVLLSPAFTELQTIVNSTVQNTKLTPADAATAANRAFLSDDDALAEAQSAGINATRFAVLRQLAGNAPAPEELAIALRRSVITESGTGPDSTSFEQGIAEGNLLDKWGPVIQQIARQVPSPADIVNAIVRNQVTAADGETLYALVGGDTDYLDLQVDINGRPPAPSELLEMAMRGVIPWTGTGPDVLSFQQGIYEGDSKDKWEPAYQILAQYWPTVSESINLYRWGIIDQAAAVQQMSERGLNAEQAAWWINYANANAVNDYRGLTEQAVLAMVSIGYMTDQQATTALQALHRGTEAIEQLLDYAHIQRAIQSVNQAITRVGALFTARKITAQTAQESLVRLGVQPIAVADIIQDWSTVAAINVKTLTVGEIVDAFDYDIMDQDTATQELVNIGYSSYDAWVLLSVKNESPLPGEPPPVVAAGPGEVVTGTT